MPTFEQQALDLYRHQASYNPLYKQYLELLGIHRKPAVAASSLHDIPFLPISFFKTHSIQTGSWTPETTFTSSGTSLTTPARHLVHSTQQYLHNTVRCFEYLYHQHPSQYCTLALLPAYLERTGSSLVCMAQYFIQLSAYPQSGFYLYNYPDLARQLHYNTQHQIPTLLLGVTFALLDFAKAHPMPLPPTCIVMETGGMKGRGEELTRTQVHQLLTQAFQVPHIHAEYGMTELLSQCYALADGRFQLPPTMHIRIRDLTDPFSYLPHQRTGGINIIDLANTHTIAFIATDDLGRTYPDGTFEVLGRIDHSDVRGCNLLIGN